MAAVAVAEVVAATAARASTRKKDTSTGRNTTESGLTGTTNQREILPIQRRNPLSPRPKNEYSVRITASVDRAYVFTVLPSLLDTALIATRRY